MSQILFLGGVLEFRFGTKSVGCLNVNESDKILGDTLLHVAVMGQNPECFLNKMENH
jgi:hypothetical protein